MDGGGFYGQGGYDQYGYGNQQQMTPEMMAQYQQYQQHMMNMGYYDPNMQYYDQGKGKGNQGKGNQNQGKGQGYNQGKGNQNQNQGKGQSQGYNQGKGNQNRDQGKGNNQGRNQNQKKKEDAPLSMADFEAARKAKLEASLANIGKKQSPQKESPKKEAPTVIKGEPAPKKKPEPPQDKVEEVTKKLEETQLEDWEVEAEAEAKAEEEAKAKAQAAEDAKAKAAAEKAKAEKEAAAKAEKEAAEKAAEEASVPPQSEEEEEVVVTKKSKDGNLKDPDPRPHFNIVFIGHVDAGKSTTCGNILYLSDQVDERLIEKYQREAKDKNRESWFLAYIMDTNDEEKAKGKTVEVGRAFFTTEDRRFTILDAPGHKAYVPNMIQGASQADVAVLIISARKGEFETGFEKGGQTREHAMLAKTLGVDKLIVAVNKMDDMSVEWAESRFDEIVTKLEPFLKKSGFKDDQIDFLPISGLTGDNIKFKKGAPAWSKHEPLFTLLNKLPTQDRKRGAALRMPMLDGFRDMGAVVAIGKIEQGEVAPGQKCILVPSNVKVTIKQVLLEEEQMSHAVVGESVQLVVSGCTEDELKKGYVLCPLVSPARAVVKFKAQMQIMELLEERPILSAGYQCVIHVHTAVEECTITKMTEALNMKTKKKEKHPRFVKQDYVLWAIIELKRSMAVSAFADCPQMGRFTLRDESKTIAIGKIIELPKEKE